MWLKTSIVFKHLLQAEICDHFHKTVILELKYDGMYSHFADYNIFQNKQTIFNKLAPWGEKIPS
jgi:hypothetical protein